MRKDFVEVPSVSADPVHKPDVERCAELGAATLRALGGRAELYRAPGGNPVVLGSFDAGPGRPTNPPSPAGASVFRDTFTGLHFIEEEVLDRLPAGRPSDIVREVYRPLVAEGRLHAWIHRGHWLEFGTPREYLDGSLRLLDLPFSQLRRFAEPDPIREFSRARVAMGAGAEAPEPETTLQGRIALGLAAHVEAGARVVDAVILPEAWIGPGTRLRRVVVGPGAEVPAGFAMEEAMICADPGDGFPLPPGTERIAGLLVRRFA